MVYIHVLRRNSSMHFTAQQGKGGRGKKQKAKDTLTTYAKKRTAFKRCLLRRRYSLRPSGPTGPLYNKTAPSCQALKYQRLQGTIRRRRVRHLIVPHTFRGREGMVNAPNFTSGPIVAQPPPTTDN